MKNVTRLSKAVSLLSQLRQLATETSLAGVYRYVKFKILSRGNRNYSTGDKESRDGLGIIGAGTYTASVHLPCLVANREPIHAITSRTRHKASTLAKIYGMDKVHDSLDALLNDARCNGLLIATPHNLHPEHILKALATGLYSYCEKPVAIDSNGIEQLKLNGLLHSNASKIMVGFNRRYAPAISQLLKCNWIANRQSPLEINYRVNFGPRVANAMSDPRVGGGRIHGAACHYVDLISFIAGSPVSRVSATSIRDSSGTDNNTFIANLTLKDGSIAGLTFTSEGNRTYGSKEEINVSCEGHVAQIRNFSRLTIDGQTNRFFRHTYGAMDTIAAFLKSKKNNEPTPISLADGIIATCVTLSIAQSISENGNPVDIIELGIS